MTYSIWPVAWITYKEGIRNRSLYGICIFAALLFVANFIISGMMMQEVGKVAVDIALSTVSLAGLLLVLFVGVSLMAKDLDKKTIYMVLARPISRSRYIAGKYIGMILLILTSVSVLGAFAFASIYLIKFSFGYFSRFSPALVLLAIAFTALMLMLVSAISFVFSSFSSSSFTTFVLTTITYIIGHSISDVKKLIESASSIGITVSPVTQSLVKGAYYVFPNLSFFDIKIQAAHGLDVSPSYVLFVVIYGIAYSSVLIALATIAFRKKEFP